MTTEELRDMFAGMAMNGLLASGHYTWKHEDDTGLDGCGVMQGMYEEDGKNKLNTEAVITAYEIADEMLKRRRK